MRRQRKPLVFETSSPALLDNVSELSSYCENYLFVTIKTMKLTTEIAQRFLGSLIRVLLGILCVHN